MDCENPYKVRNDGDLETERGEHDKIEDFCKIRCQNWNHQHDIGHPQMNVI